MRLRLSLAVLTVLILVASAPVALGQAQKGSITVTVEGPDGSRLPGARVTASSDQTLTRRTAISDTEGIANLVALDPAVNYVVTVELDSFADARFEEVGVRAGQDTQLTAALQLSEITETMIVTAEAPLVDVRSAIASSELTLDLTESLPTARSYQDYLQLVPGVQDDIDSVGNPASRSGVNYRDVLGDAGRSTDNAYYFEGINVTDRVSGLNGADLNTEIIQEQSVITGGIPAEFVGAPGLISNVVTKSGGNDFSGSVNYYFQDDSFVEDNEHFADQTFSTYDTAATFGGPIVRDKAWFFASYRLTNREDDVTAPDGTLLRTVKEDGEQGFGKLSWSITDSDLLTGIVLTDPTETTGQRANTIANAEDFSQDLGGVRWTVNYSRVWSGLALELGATDHEADLDVFANIREPENEISFRNGDPTPPGGDALGGAGDDTFRTRGINSVRGALEYAFDTGYGDHTVKGGVDVGESVFEIDDQFIGNPPASYVSISDVYLGQNLTLAQIDGSVGSGFTITEFTSDNADTINGFNEGVQASGQAAAILAAWDTNGDGFLSGEELAANMTFGDTAGNPNGQINYTRDFQASSGAREIKSEFRQAYIQDSWQWNKWSANVGVRAEQWEHIAASGDSLLEFDWEYAPRLSLNYDVRGDGRQRLSLYYGRYYDAIRNNMTQFAGDNTGRVIEEQVWVEPIQDWITFRTRGGPQVIDGFFAPTIETPYTDEIQLGYAVDLGRNMAFAVNLIDRETEDVMEDYGVFYFDPNSYPGDIDAPDTFFLGPGFLGFAPGQLPRANFFIATLPPGAFRDYQGIELIFRKRMSDNWQMLASYNYADQEGNTVSDSNADLAGDLVFLDPRAPNMTGTLPGLVEHLFKVAGSYRWDNGFEAGARYRWNSGVQLNVSGTQAFNRNVPLRVDDPFEAGGGISERWVAPGAVGGLDSPSYGILDLRGSYVWDINGRLEADFFVDVFNALDDQSETRVQDLIGGGSGFAFREGTDYVDPRRYFVGARLRF